jgi:glycosyltransferase involved in cell wall biosynthesis
MKIAIDIRILAKKRVGKASQLLYLLQGFARIAVEHEFVLYAREAPKDITFPDNFTVKIKNIPMPFWHAWCWYDFVFVEKADLFFATLSYIIPAFSKKCVVLIHDVVSFLHIAQHNSKAQIIEKLTLRQALKNARGIIAVSKNTAKDIAQVFNVSPEGISVVHEAIDPQFYEKVSEDEKKAALSAYGIDGDFIFFISTLEPRKNITRLVRAYDAAKQQNPSLPHLVMAGGEGWGYEVFAEVCQGLQHKKSIRLIGHVDPEHLRALYQSCTFYVFPALYEGFGLTVLEAMASGAPVITSRTSSLPEVGGKGALYIDPLRENDIRDALLMLWKNEKMRDQLCEKGYQQARQFDITKMARETLDVLMNAYEKKS